MSDNSEVITGAAVQAAPVFLDREKTVEKACRLIKEAGSEGADIIGFPEGYLPGHPLWIHYHAATGDLSRKLGAELFNNSIEVPSKSTDKLAKAAKEAGSYVIIGACEKEPDTTGTMYNSQLYFSPEGELIGHHQKLKPTHAEKVFHTEGKKEKFGAVETDFGSISSLICGENSNPLAVFALTMEYPKVHIMSWPSRVANKHAIQDRIVSDAKGFAQRSKSYVIAAAGAIDEHMADKLELDKDEKERLVSDPSGTGGSVIVAPDKSVVAGPADNRETILYAEMDFDISVIQKLSHDFAGHYNRPDMFQLRVDKNPSNIYAEDNISTNIMNDLIIDESEKNEDVNKDSDDKADNN